MNDAHMSDLIRVPYNTPYWADDDQWAVWHRTCRRVSTPEGYRAGCSRCQDGDG